MSPGAILVVQTAFPGDLLLTTPLLRAVHERWPDAALWVLSRPVGLDLLAGNPAVTGVLAYDKRGAEASARGLWRQWTRLRAMRFDLAILAHRSLRSAGLARAAGIPIRVAFADSPGSRLATHRVPNPGGESQARRYVALMRPWMDEASLAAVDARPAIYPNGDDHDRVARLLATDGIAPDDPLVALAPGSVWPTKRWLPERFAQVADELAKAGFRTALVGGSEDAPICRAVAARMRSHPVNLSGQTSFRESATLLGRARLVIANDSAPVHLAVAMGTPTLAIFGPTVPAFGFAPTGPFDRVVQAPLACRPCSPHGGHRCPLGHHACMREITPAVVTEEAFAVLRQANRAKDPRLASSSSIEGPS
jgi:heptosyltransferase-2